MHIVYPQKHTVMGPTQFGAQCAPNREKLIKLPHSTQFALFETLAELLGKPGG